MVSTPADDDTYGVREIIQFQVPLSAAVDVEGVVVMGTYVGDRWRGATYRSGSGTNKLIFGYKVQSADMDDDGFQIHRGYQDSDGVFHGLGGSGSIKLQGTDVTVRRTYDGIDDQEGHKVDGSITPIGLNTEITSTPASGDTYRYGETIEVSITFSAALDVEGTKHPNLREGADRDNNWRGANYKEGSGTKTLVFGYTVQPHDLDEDGITMSSSYTQGGEALGFGGSGTITVSGTDIEVPPDFIGLSDQAGHKVNGQPYAKAIAITSTPGASTDTYGRDEIIQISLSFDQTVDADAGSYALITMSIATGGGAFYASGNGRDTLIFEYQVHSVDRDDDGIDVEMYPTMNIKASETQIDYQTGPGAPAPELTEQSGHKVDGSLYDDTAPTITAVTFDDSPGPEDDSTYEEGDWIVVAVTFDENVEVIEGVRSGPPQIQLVVGEALLTAQYGVLPATAEGLSQRQDP